MKTASDTRSLSPFQACLKNLTHELKENGLREFSLVSDNNNGFITITITWENSAPLFMINEIVTKYVSETDTPDEFQKENGYVNKISLVKYGNEGE